MELHLALLVCDTPIPEVIEKYGDYPKMFAEVFKKAAVNKDISLTWSTYDVVDAQEYPTLEDIRNKKYHGIVITGSKYNAQDNDPWIIKLVNFVKAVRKEQMPVKLVGICFGHQIILRASDGEVIRNPKGWEYGYTIIKLSPEGQKYFNTDKETIRINQSHRDHVPSLPDGFKCLAFTDNSPIHSTVSNDNQCITIQGHPELSRGAIQIIAPKRMESGVLPKEIGEKCLETMRSVGPNMEDVWLVGKFLDFIIEGRSF